MAKKVDWGLKSSGPVVNGLQAALGLGAVTAVADYAAIHPIWALGAAAVGAGGTLLVRGMQSPNRVIADLARWAGAGGWSFSLLSGLADWSVGSVATLAGGAVLASCLGPAIDRREQAAAAALASGGISSGGLMLGSTARECAQWQQALVRVYGQVLRGVVVENVREWPNRYGKDVDVLLPANGVTSDTLRRGLPGLATVMDLPRGCPIELVEPEGSRRRVVLRVSTVNRLNADIPYPVDGAGVESILEGIPFGEHADASIASAPIREDSWLIVGKRGSGKTTLLHGLTATIGSCRDALVWHIDLNGGSLTQPWIEPWLRGEVARPPVDWAAPTVDEAILMMRAAVRMAKHRKVAYRGLKRKHNVSLLPISPELPAVEIIIDEGAEALAAAGRGKVAELANLLAEIQRIARDAAINEVISALRGTSDLIPAAMTSQTGVSICMRVEQEKELAAVFGWHSGVDYRDLRRKGSGFVGTDRGIQQFQSWNILPAQIEEIGMRISRQRPDLDAATARAGGEEYATRYERMRELFEDPDALIDPADSDSSAVLARAAAPVESGRWTVTAGWDDPGVRREQVRVALAPAREDEDIVERIIALMDERGEDRIPREVAARELTGGDDEELRRRVAEAGGPAPRSIRYQGLPARGWYRRDLEAVREMVSQT